jgi:hypothetical protein
VPCYVSDDEMGTGSALGKEDGMQVTNYVHKFDFEFVRYTNIHIKYNFVIEKITVSGSPSSQRCWITQVWCTMVCAEQI